MQQLQMIFPQGVQLPEPVVPEDYKLRLYRDGDARQLAALMVLAGFEDWTEEKVWDWYEKSSLPDSYFVIEYLPEHKVVATASASHHPREYLPVGGELGWVAADPDHSGKGLGITVCTAAVKRLQAMGYGTIYLNTDDERLAAIKTYLKMGFIPFLSSEDAEGRWRKVCEQLKWPPEPAQWIRPDLDKVDTE